MLAIESALLGGTVTERVDLGILGAPVDINGCRTGVHKAVERLCNVKLAGIDSSPLSSTSGITFRSRVYFSSLEAPRATGYTLD